MLLSLLRELFIGNDIRECCFWIYEVDFLVSKVTSISWKLSVNKFPDFFWSFNGKTRICKFNDFQSKSSKNRLLGKTREIWINNFKFYLQSCFFNFLFTKFMFSEKIFERRGKNKFLYDFIYFCLLLRSHNNNRFVDGLDRLSEK